MMSIPPYPWIVAGSQRKRTTDLDRYVRAEFGDCETAWFANGVRPNHSDRTSRESGNDDRLLRRLTQAIASFF